MEKEKKKHTFTITHHGHKIILESEVKQAEALKALLSATFFSFRAKYPDKLHMLVEAYNALYNAAIKEEALKEAKKAGVELLAADEPEPDTFEFYEWLMQVRFY